MPSRAGILLGSAVPIFVVLALAATGCGADGRGGTRTCATSSDCPSGACVDGVCQTARDAGPRADGSTSPDGAAPDSAIEAGAPRCTSDTQCVGGVCLDGACCASAAWVCGSSCCARDETCFANACVRPGAPCRTSTDCATGEYCEPALGASVVADSDGGVDAGVDGGGMEFPMDAAPGDAGPTSCVPPLPGRCLALPPRCAGAEPAPGETCIHDCEYHPPVATLDAVQEWTWGPEPREFPNHIDVWSTPAVGRLQDTNCDGVVDSLDAADIVFVSGNSEATCCSCGDVNRCITGVLRVLDGRTGEEVWSLRRAAMGSVGFAGVSVALANVDADGAMEIFVVTGEGRVALVDDDGTVLATSMTALPGSAAGGFGWGGGLAVADMDGDGRTLELSYGRGVFRWDGTAITHLWTGTGGIGRGNTEALSFFVDLDPTSPGLELLAGRTAYKSDGTILWNRSEIPEGFSAVGDFDRDGTPEVALVSDVQFYVLDGLTGTTELGPVGGRGTGNGGPPTVADFDGDGSPEIGVATQNFYTVLKPDYAHRMLNVMWESPNHDLSSSVTGSTVFDFEGDGAAEVVYNDECFLWVYDGRTGAVRFAGLTQSFTATEASLVADVDGDGQAEIVMVSNGASPSGWHCTDAPWTMPDGVRPGWHLPAGLPAYRGITVWGDRTGGWVGTRDLWNQHAYSVSNVCSDRDDACDPPAPYGTIPAHARDNWGVSWLNNFRQNVQGSGIFDAPDAVVTLAVECGMPQHLVASVRNLGAALLPSGVVVGFYVRAGGTDRMIGTGTTDTALFPGQVAPVSIAVPDGLAPDTVFVARILIDEATRTFHECHEDNDESGEVTARCLI